jgi:hypothetical protein
MKTAETPQYETIISIVVLLVLCGVALAVILPQFNILPQQTAQSGSGNLENILSSLKSSGFAPSKLETYNADTLYEKIDGKAPLYTDTGFEKLFTRVFKDNSQDSQTFEIYVYDMGNAKNALAVYSQQIREDAQALPDADFGYKTTNALFYSLGKYYIEIIGSAESSQLLGAMTSTADQIKKEVTAGNPVKSDEMQILEKAGSQAGSLKFYIDSAFGCSQLTNVFSSVIKVDDKPVTIFLSKRSDDKDAASLVSTYSKFLTGLDAKDKKIDLPVSTGAAFDFFGPIEVVFSSKEFVAGVHGAPDDQSASKAAKTLYDTLQETGKK